ncbi:TolC family protein [Siphonobacter sp. SORGH_AS_0500]|uniref:TolC family protein n=1 Tax=Siphonobacter sp. SORGH_AS_0500 TaxID=1864824 RepID=UPI0028672121|nr:TolC family protein [Siphonobacter sp. SORGH_AS_0500]MDR6196969.1 outer membrane protein TolC [Siphonobacter sp. SORGH_AS_0500]
MKKLYLNRWGLLLCMLWASYGSYAQSAFSLQQAIEYGLKNNRNVTNAQLDLAIAKARIGETKAMGLPQANVALGLSHTIKPQPFFMPPGMSFIPGEPAPPGDEELALAFGGVRYNSSAVASLNWLLFSNSYLLGLKAAKVYTDLSSKNITASKITVAENITKAYYAVLVNEERLNLLEVNVHRLDTLLRDTRASNLEGLVEKIDVQRIEVQRNNLVTEQQNVQRLQDLAYILLKYQMGHPLDQSFELSEKLAKLSFSEEMIQAIKRPFQYGDRIEYATLQTQRDLQTIDVKNVQRSLWPTLSLQGTYGYYNGRQSIARFITRPWLDAGSIGFAINVPVFDGFTRRYKLSQSRSNLLKVENNMELLKQSIDLQLSQSEIQLRNYWFTLQEQQKNLDLAQEVLRVTQIKYKEGVGSNIEVINAEASFREAQTNYYTALYNAIVAKVDLDKAAGKLYVE